MCQNHVQPNASERAPVCVPPSHPAVLSSLHTHVADDNLDATEPLCAAPRGAQCRRAPLGRGAVLRAGVVGRVRGLHGVRVEWGEVGGTCAHGPHLPHLQSAPVKLGTVQSGHGLTRFGTGRELDQAVAGAVWGTELGVGGCGGCENRATSRWVGVGQAERRIRWKLCTTIHMHVDTPAHDMTHPNPCASGPWRTTVKLAHNRRGTHRAQAQPTRPPSHRSAAHLGAAIWAKRNVGELHLACLLHVGCQRLPRRVKGHVPDKHLGVVVCGVRTVVSEGAERARELGSGVTRDGACCTVQHHRAWLHRPWRSRAREVDGMHGVT